MSCGLTYNCNEEWQASSNSSGGGKPCADFTGSLNSVCAAGATWTSSACCHGVDEGDKTFDEWEGVCSSLNVDLSVCVVSSVEAPQQTASPTPTLVTGASSCANKNLCFASEVCEQNTDCASGSCRTGKCSIESATMMMIVVAGVFALALLCSGCCFVAALPPICGSCSRKRSAATGQESMDASVGDSVLSIAEKGKPYMKAVRECITHRMYSLR